MSKNDLTVFHGEPPVCEYCGVVHPVTALCTSAPRGRGMSRRSFLFLAGAGTAGLLLAPSIAAPQEVTAWQMSVNRCNVGQLVAEAWNNLIQPPGDNAFEQRYFAVAMSREMKRLKGQG